MNTVPKYPKKSRDVFGKTYASPVTNTKSQDYYHSSPKDKKWHYKVLAFIMKHIFGPEKRNALTGRGQLCYVSGDSKVNEKVHWGHNFD